MLLLNKRSIIPGLGHVVFARRTCNRSPRVAVALILGLTFHAALAFGQTAATGAIAGVITDPSGAAVPGATVIVTNQATGAARTVTSSGTGKYLVPLLPPGAYQVQASKTGFKKAEFHSVLVNVTETETLNVQFQVGAANETVEVNTTAEQLQTESSALGHVTNSQMIENLPLVTRNYTQILALSPGVAADVTNAGALGPGGASTGDEPLVANGGASSDNNFQMNGVEINDLQQSGSFSGGIAVPNPDTIQEFKVQTAQYDAAFGRGAGANVDVITKGGSNEFHGTLFEFFRNEALNANEYFRKLNDQPRPRLRQNQFGFTLGGPIRKDKLLFFTSYQGTRQSNGVDPNCSSSFFTPPLTNDRSAAALGALFAGQPTFIQLLFGPGIGPNVLPDGSNIAPQALALLQKKLPDGSYLIPTPQRVDPTQPFATQGSSSFSLPCRFSEEQFMTNGDWLQSDKSKFSVRFFFANSHNSITLPYTNLGGPTSPGFPTNTANHFRNVSLTHTYLFSSNLLNQAVVAYRRQFSNVNQSEAFTYSDVGVNAPAFDNAIPEIFINGALTLGGNGQGLIIGQNGYNFQDDLVWTRGRHSLRFGGGVTRAQDNVDQFHFLAGLLFLSFPDFLLGQDGITNGTGLSNVYGTLDLPGLFNRKWRVWEYNGYAQDDLKLSPRLTLNLGLRFEHLGDLGDELGRNATFDITHANPNPPASGSLQGFVVSDNYQGVVPSGVRRSDNNLGIRGEGQNTWGPRAGFAWQVPPSQNLVLRAGYGVYYQRVSGQPVFQLLIDQPFARLREFVGLQNTAASFANPFPAGAPTFPSFTPYSPSTQLSTFTFAQNFRPPIYQRYTVNVQDQIAKDLVWELGYVGTRGTHLIRNLAANQALLASASNPVHGETTNTTVNVAQRAPLLGWTTTNLLQVESEGASWYNALETSLSKRFAHGLQFLASYTFAKDLSTDVMSTTGANGGSAVGNQRDPRARYGVDQFVRQHRFVVSYLYDLPFFRNNHSALGYALGGWRVSGVTVLQSGHLLSVFNTNVNNVYGINGFGTDFAQFAPNCDQNHVNTPGSVTSKLNNYINASCFTAPPVVGDPELDPATGTVHPIATGFGNSRPGIIHGPDQRNTDLAISKQFGVRWPNETANVEFRGELFNAFNTPQFADPDTEQDSATFGQILTTVASPRVVQFALKFNF